MTEQDAAWAPERIWLLRDADGGPGHHLWCQDPDPAGDGTESIAYVRLDAPPRRGAEMTAPYTAAELAAILAKPPSWVCTKCGYCGSEGPDHMRSDGEPCRYMPGNTRAREHRLAAELTRADETR